MLQKVHTFVARKNNVVIDTLFDMKKKGRLKNDVFAEKGVPGRRGAKHW